MKRYNCVNGPVDMEEDKDGYWITHEEHTQSVLDANKLVEKSWRARDSQSIRNASKVDHLHDVIVGLSVALFVSVASLIFIGMTK
jgi:hypothetical protein